MTKQFVPAIVGILIGAWIAWFALSQHNPLPGRTPRTLTIGIYTPPGARNCEVDFPDAVISLSRHDKIAWESEDQQYTVMFAPSGSCSASGTPFGSGTINVPASASGTPPVGQTPLRSGNYCYEVFAGSATTGQPCVDPGLHVKN